MRSLCTSSQQSQGHQSIETINPMTSPELHKASVKSCDTTIYWSPVQIYTKTYNPTIKYTHTYANTERDNTVWPAPISFSPQKNPRFWCHLQTKLGLKLGGRQSHKGSCSIHRVRSPTKNMSTNISIFNGCNPSWVIVVNGVRDERQGGGLYQQRSLRTLYYTVLYCTILYYTILYCTILYYTGILYIYIQQYLRTFFWSKVWFWNNSYTPLNLVDSVALKISASTNN